MAALLHSHISLELQNLLRCYPQGQFLINFAWPVFLSLSSINHAVLQIHLEEFMYCRFFYADNSRCLPNCHQLLHSLWILNIQHLLTVDKLNKFLLLKGQHSDLGSFLLRLGSCGWFWNSRFGTFIQCVTAQVDQIFIVFSRLATDFLDVISRP